MEAQPNSVDQKLASGDRTRSLYVQPFALTMGETYVFSCTINVASEDPAKEGIIFQNVASVEVGLMYADLVIALTRGTFAIHFVEAPIVVDASPSYDIDDPEDKFAAIEIMFSCLDVTKNSTCYRNKFYRTDGYLAYSECTYPDAGDRTRFNAFGKSYLTPDWDDIDAPFCMDGKLLIVEPNAGIVGNTYQFDVFIYKNIGDSHRNASTWSSM
jgi:hypothetical protein